jgi:hypothetical protein
MRCRHALALAVVFWPSAPAHGLRLPPRKPDTLRVPAVVAGKTMVAYEPKTPPPWPAGNCFSLALVPVREVKDFKALLRVVNMTAENFERVVGDKGIESVQVLRVSPRDCLITDPRIPREWLRETPCAACFGRDYAAELKRRYPDLFHAGSGR